MNTIKFGTDGWRGVIAEDFTFANARIVARAIARYVVRAEDPRKGVMVGYDHRFGSERVARAVAEVVQRHGTPVWLTDKPCPDAGDFPAGAATQRGRRNHGHREPQSLPVERHEIQGQLRQQRAALDRGANRKRIGGGSVQRRAAIACAQGFDPFARYRARRIWKPSKSWSTGSACATRNFGSLWIPCTASAARPAARTVHAQRRQPAKKFAARAIRCSAVSTRNPSSRTSRRCAKPSCRQVRRGLCADGDGDRIGAIDRDGSFRQPAPDFCAAGLAPDRHPQAPWRHCQNFFRHQADRQARRQIRPQASRSAHRLQIHLRADAGAEHSDWRRRERRDRHQLVLAGARRHGFGAVAGGAHGLAWQISRRADSRASRGIRRIPLRPHRSGRHVRAKTESDRALLQ